MQAVKSALEGGIVAGGGMALFKVSCDYPPLGQCATAGVLAGVSAVRHSMREPLRVIVQNAGGNICKIEGEVCSHGGWDAHTGSYVDDMVEFGIIDPAKVVCAALKNAASVAGVLLTTQVIIAEVEDKV